MLGLPIEEAVWESYEEALEGEEHVPGEDEDGGHGGGGALGAHDREDVGDAQHRHDDDQRLSTNHSSVLPPSDQSQLSIATLGPITAQYYLGGPQVDVLRGGVEQVRGPQLGYHHLRMDASVS